MKLDIVFGGELEVLVWDVELLRSRHVCALLSVQSTDVDMLMGEKRTSAGAWRERRGVDEVVLAIIEQPEAYAQCMQA